jgi:hypothetical protein
MRIPFFIYIAFSKLLDGFNTSTDLITTGRSVVLMLFPHTANCTTAFGHGNRRWSKSINTTARILSPLCGIHNVAPYILGG